MIVLFVFIYLSASFVVLTFDVTAWEQVYRHNFIVLSWFSNIINTCIYFIRKPT